MSYCTITEVRGVNAKRTYDTTTTPTQVQVEEFIERIAAEIDVVMGGRGLTVPVTTPAALVTFLEQLNALGAAAMAEQAMFPESKGQMSVPAGAVLWKRYQDGLAWLKEGSLPSDADDAAAIPFGLFTREEGSSTAPKETYRWQRPKFGKDKDF